MKNKHKIREFKCLGCGKIVKLRRSKDKLKYCSVDCYRKSRHPQNKKGETVKCEWCGKDVYKPQSLLNYKHHFCSVDCANKWQGRNKIEFTCKICGKKFKLSKSIVESGGRNPTYCSIECRNKDDEWVKNACIKGNLVQQNKKGLNKLELIGRSILEELNIDFDEQVLMFNKFLVDVLLKDKPIIIQWDGEYWHSKPNRKKLDISQDAYLSKCGYKVLRFTDKDIKKNRGKVYEDIKRAIR